MKKNLCLLIIAALILNFSCKKENTQMKEVMAIHDEVMPEMGTIGKLVGELKKIENDSTETGQKYMEARIDLQEAHESMMDWMKGFGDRFDYEEISKGKQLSEQKQLWLDEEEEKVKALRDQINGSIKNAKILLKKE